jgi:tRNA A37 threonylcarbamoyladenosine synthetase subunit TsaC/SUA5/YrdC
LSGHTECTTAIQVKEQLSQKVPIIIDGGKSLRDVPSTIVYLANGAWKLMREGAISVQQIEDFLGDQ